MVASGAVVWRAIVLVDESSTRSAGREYAHAAFQPTIAASIEHELWDELHERLSNEFDAAQLLRPGPEIEAEVRRVAREIVSASRKRAAMRGDRLIEDPDRCEQVLV